MDNQKLIIHLIGEQIRNMLFISSLENLGFDCSLYTLNICEEILTLAGFLEKSDNLYQYYFGLIDIAIKETSYQNLDKIMGKWSMKIYLDLMDIKFNGNIPTTGKE